MSREKLLVVDDEPDLLAELVPLLKRAGYEVQTAADGQQALLRVQRQQPDLVVLDVLKNPLTTIRLGIANLQECAGLGEAEAASLGRNAAQAQRLGALIENLRLVTELNEQGLEHNQIELREVLENAVALACPDPEKQPGRIALTFQQIPWPVTYVQGDPDLLVMAFRNLIENAIKFSRSQGRVEVRASENGRETVVEVADTGCGIPAEELPQVFEELYRGANARDLPGSGLGLALVKRIVVLHGGRVEVRSRLDQGTVVSVYLPLTQ